MNNPFTKHPDSIGETYFGHMRCALFFSWRLFAAALTAFIHALFPFLFEKTATNHLAKIMDKINCTERKGQFAQQLENCKHGSSTK